MQFTEEQFAQMLSFFRREYVPRKFFFMKVGQVARYKAYINKGSTRSFTTDESGGVHILHFCFKDWWIGYLERFYTQQTNVSI